MSTHQTNPTDRILNDIKWYMRISAAAAMKSQAASIIDSLEKADIYSRLNGQLSQRKLEEMTKVPQKTISNRVEVFVKAHLVAPPDEYSSNHRALFTLEELGIEPALLKKRAKPATKASAKEGNEDGALKVA